MNRVFTKQYGRALIQPTTLDKANRTVDVVFATETPVFRTGWEEDYNEVLQCTAVSVRVERINKGLPVLDTHKTYSVLNQFGRTIKVWFDEKKREMWATIRFSQRAEVEGVFKDIEDGIVSDISVGYRVYKFEREPQAEGERPIYRAVDWMPTELSFCSIGADINSGTRSAQEGDTNEVIIIDKIRNMAQETKESPKNEGTPQKTPDIENIRKEATTAERTRLNSILTSVRSAGLPDTYGIELYQSDKTVEDCRQEIIIKAAGKQTQPPNSLHDARVGAEAIDKKRTAVEGMILNRVAPSTF